MGWSHTTTGWGISMEIDESSWETVNDGRGVSDSKQADKYKPEIELEYGINESRIEDCVNVIANNMNKVEILRFDTTEPEFDALKNMKERMSEQAFANLATGSCIINYQLGTGGADAFWPALIDTLDTTDFDVETPEGSYRTLHYFLHNYDVNNRIINMRGKRLKKWYESGYSEWVFENYTHDKVLETWYKLAESVDSDMYKKTIMLGVKMLDYIYLLYEDDFYPFPIDTPIPSDIQVRKICGFSGMIPPEKEKVNMTKLNRSVRIACQKFIEELDRKVDMTSSLFRIDSILFQFGREVQWSRTRERNMEALIRYIRDVTSLNKDKAGNIAQQFTIAQSNYMDFEFNAELVDNFDENEPFTDIEEKIQL